MVPEVESTFTSPVETASMGPSAASRAAVHDGALPPVPVLVLVLAPVLVLATVVLVVESEPPVPEPPAPPAPVVADVEVADDVVLLVVVGSSPPQPERIVVIRRIEPVVFRENMVFTFRRPALAARLVMAAVTSGSCAEAAPFPAICRSVARSCRR